MEKAEINAKLKEAIVELDNDLAEKAAREAVSAGLEPMEAIEEGLSAGIQVVSDLFEDGKIFIPELMMAAEAFEKAVEILTASMTKEDLAGASNGTILLHTVEGDVHDIGKNIVRTFLNASNFTVHDLGRDVPVETVVEKAQELNVDIIAGSALMSTTMPRQRDIINLLKELGIRDRFIVLFGGAPVTKQWCDSIGADGYSDVATDAPVVAKAAMAKKRGSQT